nr:uncharacterized protein LOC113807559 [Penaeus vannamei]
MIELAVLEPPRVDVQPRRKIVRNGGSIVRLNCTATGVPLPEVTWHKDGRRSGTGRQHRHHAGQRDEHAHPPAAGHQQHHGQRQRHLPVHREDRVGWPPKPPSLRSTFRRHARGALEPEGDRTSPSSIEVKWDRLRCRPGRRASARGQPGLRPALLPDPEQQNHLIGEPSATLVVRTMASRESGVVLAVAWRVRLGRWRVWLGFLFFF